MNKELKCSVCGKKCPGLICRDCYNDSMEDLMREEELARTED